MKIGNTVNLSYQCTNMTKCVFDAWNTSGTNIKADYYGSTLSNKPDYSLTGKVTSGIQSGVSVSGKTPPATGYVQILTIQYNIGMMQSTYERATIGLYIGLSKTAVCWYMIMTYISSLGACLQEVNIRNPDPIKFTIQYT